MKKHRLALIIALCAIVYIMSYFHRVTPTILSVDLLADFRISPPELGIFSSAAMLAYGAMQLPSGLLSDLLGGRRVLACLSVIAGLGTIWFSLTHSMDGVFFSRFLTGIGLAVTVPIITVLAEWCPPSMFVRISSFILSMAGLGGILAAPPLHALSEHFGWRTSMAGFGVFSLVLALLLLLIIPGRKQQATPQQSMTLPELGAAAYMVFKSKIFRTLGIWYMLICGASYCMSTLWWGPYLMQGLGLSKTTASSVVSGISLGIMVWFIGLGALTGTVFKNLKTILVFCTLLACASLSLLVFGAARLPVPVITLAAAVFAACSSAIGPITYSMMKDNYPPSMSGTAVGIVNMTFPLWAALLQFVYGGIISCGERYFPACNPHDIALAFILLNCLAALPFLLSVPRKPCDDFSDKKGTLC